MHYFKNYTLRIYKLFFSPALFLIILLSGLFKEGQAQSTELQIRLPDSISSPLFEYSGLAMYKSKLLLLQQYPVQTFPGIDTADIGRQLNGDSSSAAAHYWQIRHLDNIIRKLPFYQGFEAATVVGDEIFLSIETLDEDPWCYLIKGSINDSLIILDTTRIAPLKKLRKESGDSTITIHNIGFEAMTWLPARNRLLLLFEYNRYPKISHGFLVNKDLSQVKPILVNPIDFRITDLINNNGNIYGINYYYKGEFELFNPQEKIRKDDGYADWTRDCFSRIVKLNVKKNKVSFKVIQNISFNNDNWEGIMNFRNGVLLITDRHPESKMVFVALK